MNFQKKCNEKRIGIAEDLAQNAAIEAEIRAQQQRATIPLAVRIESFKAMLAEKQVSPFSTWEKELSKIVFDERYLLLSSKERKTVSVSCAARM